MATGHTRTNDGPGGGLCLLSVDGGGVRGLSSLYLLEQLMESVNKKANNDPPLKPYEYFDMIGGTSTGGIIAIMLGRLRMSIRDCIDAYIRLSDKVFKKIHYSPVSWKGRAQGRFDHKALETAIKDVVISAGLPDDALLKDDRPDSCKVFVCALSDRLSAFVPFTSYRGPRGDHDLYEQATIIQACRATSAASTFFDPITIALGPPGAEYEEKFIDGALGYNNPIRQLWTEAGDIWGGPLERKIDCLVSLGTGKPALGDFGPGVRDLGRRLLGVATETQQTADQFYNDRRPDLLEEQRYYRFNVDRGLTNIGLEEAQKKATIIRATKEYLRDGETFDKMRMCVGKLASRQWLRELTQSSLALAEEARLCFEAFEMKETNGLSVDDHIWFTNTALYCAWVDPPVGTAASAFLCCSMKERSHFGLTFWGQSRIRGSNILYFDCSADLRIPLSVGNISSNHPILVSSTATIMLWSIIAQGLHERCDSTEQARMCIWNCWRTDPTAFTYHGTDRAAPKATLEAFRRLLSAVFELGNDKEMFIVIDHIDYLPEKSIESMRQMLQRLHEVMDIQLAAKLRYLLVAKGRNEALQEIVVVDEDTEYHECLKCLRFDAMYHRRNRIASAEIGTNDWIWSHPSYLEWEEKASGILWIEGKPGSGKSVLAVSILKRFLQDSGLDKSNHNLDRAASSGNPALISSWFYSIRDNLVAHVWMVRSILLQLLEQNPSLFPHVQHIYRKRRRRSQRDGLEWEASPLNKTQWDAADIASVLPSISRNSTTPIICVLDGFDESADRSNNHEDILSLLNKLVKGSSNIKVIVLSRPTVDIEKRLRKCHHIVMQDENSNDITQIIDIGVQSLNKALSKDDDSSDQDIGEEPSEDDEEEDDDEKLKKLSCRDAGEDANLGTMENGHARSLLRKQPTAPSKRQKNVFELSSDEEDREMKKIRQYLSANARGVVLWVTTVLHTLQERFGAPLYDLREIRKELEHLPKDLQDLYHDIAKGLNDSLDTGRLEMARRALMWTSVVTSTRPFYVAELLDALAIDSKVDLEINTNIYPRRMFAIRSSTQARRKLQRLCGPFIEIMPPADRWHFGMLDTTIEADHEVQLLHQTVKDFLEDETCAGQLYSPFQAAKKLVEEESQIYVRIALPAKARDYSPLPVMNFHQWESSKQDVIEYLEQRRLLPFILGYYPKLKDEVSGNYLFISGRHQSKPNLTQPAIPEPEALPIVRRPPPGVAGEIWLAEAEFIVNRYLQIACGKGYITATQTLMHLTTLDPFERVLPNLYMAPNLRSLARRVKSQMEKPADPPCRLLQKESPRKSTCRWSESSCPYPVKLDSANLTDRTKAQNIEKAINAAFDFYSRLRIYREVGLQVPCLCCGSVFLCFCSLSSANEPNAYLLEDMDFPPPVHFFHAPNAAELGAEQEGAEEGGKGDGEKDQNRRHNRAGI